MTLLLENSLKYGDFISRFQLNAMPTTYGTDRASTWKPIGKTQ
ncbi:hypothetical protein [Burkholderia pseudomallei]|nr:hypothetical protein [Burkholderia pseudomallei]